MRNYKRLTGVLATALLLATGCQKDDRISERNNATLSVPESRTNIAGALSPELSARLEQFSTTVAAQFPDGLKPALKGAPDVHTEFQEMALRAMAVQPTPCDANTPVNLWLNKQLSDWNATVINFVLDADLLNVPTYNALYFENSSANQTFGLNGAYTQIMTKSFKDMKRFWNIPSDDIALVSLSGSVLRDKGRLQLIYSVIYGLPEYWANYYATMVSEVIGALPQLRNGNHPIFTFNAFALNGFSDPVLGTVPDKIAMGDGIMEGYAAIGYGDVAPQTVLAHEFGHHIQFELKLFGAVRSPEATRRTELMADGFSAYFLSHARGASMQWKRVQQFLQVFYNIGDCSFTSSGHHGTPQQRIAAAAWAYGVADGAQKQGHILTSQQFTSLFEAKLPSLVQ